MKSAGARFVFGPFVLIPSEHTLLREGNPVHLARLDFELLALLVEHAGHLVRKEELLQRLWPDTVVEEGNLTKHVSTLRKALGDGAGGSRLIQTVAGVGIRFAAPVTRVEPSMQPAGRDGSSRRMLAAGTLVVAALAVGLALSLKSNAGVNGSTRWTAFAVLPFSTLGGEDPDHIGLGLADGIITRLSGQKLLPVRPTSAVYRFRTGDRPATSEIGKALNVDVILEGHVRRAGDMVRVTVQLTDVQSGSPLWGETFDQRTAEVFRLEDAIAERVVSALRLRLAAADQQRLRRRYTTNAEAYAAYIAGRGELMRYTPAGTRAAIQAFDRALALDSGYTLARAGVAMASADMYLRFAPQSELPYWAERAEREALAAIAEDPDTPEAHVARAAVHRKREFDWEATIDASRRALVLNSNLDQPRYFIAAALYHQGLMAEALAEMERGRRTGGPDRVEPLRIAGLVALFSGDFAAARQRLEEVARHSNRAIADTYLALAYYYSGQVSRGRAMLEELTKESSASTSARSRVALAGLLGASGEPQAARQLVDSVLAGTYRDHHVEYGLGAAFAQLGEPRVAVGWLQKAADNGFPCATWYERDPLLAPLRQDPAFTSLLSALAARRAVAAERFGSPRP
jgi:DNA-binding winged helix-turn-helix (wHTH) protein/TolB-like protein/tetratricopeptide (TPR) repeat protein